MRPPPSMGESHDHKRLPRAAPAGAEVSGARGTPIEIRPSRREFMSTTPAGRPDLETSPTHRRSFLPRNEAEPRQNGGRKGSAGASLAQSARFSDAKMFCLPTVTV